MGIAEELPSFVKHGCAMFRRATPSTFTPAGPVCRVNPARRDKLAKLRVHNFAMSVDGFAAGPRQDVEHPLGVGGPRLHEWVFETKLGRAMIGADGVDEGVDNDFFAAGVSGIGATVMGRNMFGPVRGPWGASDWRGWWGDEPPYHHPVFVLTHPHDPIEMAGGTTFHFVTDGVEAALQRAFDAAGRLDVRLARRSV